MSKLHDIAAKTIKHVEHHKALREVNLRIEKLGRRLVKMNWSPEYVGTILFGVGVDMLERAHVPRQVLHDAIDHAFGQLDAGEAKSAFDTKSDPGDTEKV
jgi:hypothetical protein